MSDQSGEMLFCERCGAGLGTDSAFCAKCGAPTGRGPGEARPNGSSTDGRRNAWITGAIGLVVVLLVAGVVVSRQGRVEVGNAGADSESPATTMAPASPPTTQPLDDAALAAKFGDAVYMVEVTGCDETASGSAFAVDEHHLVTNRHVVAANASVSLHSREGAVIDGTVIGTSTDPDVAVIQTDASLPTVVGWADTSSLSEGQHLVGLGYPVPATDFTVTPGSILSFETADAKRVAIRTDAALDHGDSGGPALTPAGTVAGVITQLASNDQGVQTIVLVFTAEQVRATVDGLIATQPGFTADCSALDLPTAPDPSSAAAPSASPNVPPIQVPSIPEYTTTTRPPCPTGAPSVAVTSVQVVDQGYGSFVANVRGTVRNDAAAAVSIVSVDVDVAGALGTTIGLMDSLANIPPGQSVGWSATAYLTTGGAGHSATAKLSYWSWADVDYFGCPAPY